MEKIYNTTGQNNNQNKIGGYFSNQNMRPNKPSDSFTSRVLSIIGASGLVLVLLVIGVGTMLAGRVWDPHWNPLRPNPDKVISAALLKMRDVAMVHSDYKIELLSGKKININGVFDASSPLNLKSQGRIDFSMPFMEADAAFKVNYKIIGQDSYINIVDGTDSYFLKPFWFNVKKNKGAWLKYSFLDDYRLIYDNFYKNVWEDLYKNKSKKNNIIKTKLQDATVESQKVYRYLMKLDGKDYAKLKSFKDLIPPSLFVTEQINLELSIGSEDGYIYGLIVENVVNTGFSEFSGSNEMANFYIDIKNSKFNEPVIIEVPMYYEATKEILNFEKLKQIFTK